MADLRRPVCDMSGLRLGGSSVLVLPGTLPFSLIEGTTPPEDADQINVWIVTNGVPIRLTPYTDPTCSSPPCADEMHSPRLSTDGSLVAYCDFDPDSPFGMAVWAVPVDGSATYPLTALYEDANGAWMNHPCWNPDGSTIVFTDANADAGTGFTQSLFGGQIREVTYPGAVDTVLWTPQLQTPVQREEAWHPEYSPDGTMIAFLVSIRSGGGGTLSRQGLWVMDSDGSNATLLDNWDSSTTDAGCMRSGTQLAWSHDSQWIAYIDGGFGVTPSASTSYSVWKIQPDGSNKTLLKDGFGDSLVCKLGHGAWATDDSFVICTASAAGNNRQAIFTVLADGSLTETQIVSATDGVKGTQNFEVCYRDPRSNRINWVFRITPNPVIIRTSEVDGTDMQNTYAPVDATVANGTGFEWV